MLFVIKGQSGDLMKEDKPTLGMPGKAALGDVVDESLANQPATSESVIEKQRVESADQKAWIATLVDRHGKRFDPQVHLVGGDGDPLLTTNGKLRLQTGRPKKARPVDATPSAIGVSRTSSAPGMPGVDDETKRMQAAVTGQAAASATFTIAMILGGDEWRPKPPDKDGVDEAVLVADAYKDYFIAKNIVDFPPGVALSMALFYYAAPRFTQPTTQARTKRAWTWIKTKFRGMKKSDARTDTRDDGERENDVSKKDVDDVPESGNQGNRPRSVS